MVNIREVLYQNRIITDFNVNDVFVFLKTSKFITPVNYVKPRTVMGLE